MRKLSSPSFLPFLYLPQSLSSFRWERVLVVLVFNYKDLVERENKTEVGGIKALDSPSGCNFIMKTSM
jgi:hypothetical protein